MQRGRQNEKRALAELGLDKYTIPITDDKTGYRTIPDAMPEGSLVEIKDVKKMRWTPQIQAQVNIAHDKKLDYTIYTGKNTYIPKKFKDLKIHIEMLDFLGPQ